MKKLVVAIASDLHCHHSSAGYSDTVLISDLLRWPATSHPVSSLIELIGREAIHADILATPGDIASRMDRQGLISGWSMLGEIAAALEADVIAPASGNHDVRSREKVSDPFADAKGLAPRFPNAIQAIHDSYWARGYYLIDGEAFRIVGINSSAGHNNEITAKRGLVSNTLLADLEADLSRGETPAFQIAVCHHHPLLHEDIGLGTDDVMENGSLLTQLLSRYRFDTLIHGHKHHPKLSIFQGDHPLPVLAAGSFSAALSGGLGTRTRNLFHLLELSIDESRNPTRGGLIRSWQFQMGRGWAPANVAAADFPSIVGFGHYESPSSLATRIEDAYRSTGVPAASWSEIQSKIPEVDFVAPTTLSAVDRELRARQIKLHPAAPDRPNFIGL